MLAVISNNHTDVHVSSRAKLVDMNLLLKNNATPSRVSANAVENTSMLSSIHHRCTGPYIVQSKSYLEAVPWVKVSSKSKPYCC
jgi:hypothetical protein